MWFYVKMHGQLIGHLTISSAKSLILDKASRPLKWLRPQLIVYMCVYEIMYIATTVLQMYV